VTGDNDYQEEAIHARDGEVAPGGDDPILAVSFLLIVPPSAALLSIPPRRLAAGLW